jgi:hypothetical protein
VGRDKLLAGLLRAVGLVEAAALIAVVMPRPWMNDVHVAMGLGELPPGPVVEYLARTVSFIYGGHGVLLWLLATDPPRYKPLIVFTGVAYLVTAVVFLAINVVTRMPSYWTIIEPAACLVVGGMIVLLVAPVRGDGQKSEARNPKSETNPKSELPKIQNGGRRR